MPEALRPYLKGSPEFIEYTKELPKDSTSLKVKGKAEGKGGRGPQPKIEPATETKGEAAK